MRDYLYGLATDRNTGLVAACLKPGLFILSLAYGLVVRALIFKRRLFPARMACAVVSIGNVTVGGTGKTPLVELVARFLAQEGHKVAVISRGYGKGRGQADEPLMLAGRLKDVSLIVDADRVRATRVAIDKRQADTVVFDDGLQQWHIKKDLEIVTIDAGNPFGNGCLIPRGIMRQPLSTLDKVDIFVITKANIGGQAALAKERLARINPGARIFEASYRPAGFYAIGKSGDRADPAVLGGKKVFLFSGIADPDSFASLAAQTGAVITGHEKFGDHHRYSREDLGQVIQKAACSRADWIVTTEKDAVKLPALTAEPGQAEIGVLSMEIEIHDGKEFYNRLRSLYRL